MMNGADRVEFSSVEVRLRDGEQWGDEHRIGGGPESRIAEDGAPCVLRTKDLSEQCSARAGNVPDLLETGGHSWCEPESPSSKFRLLGDAWTLGDTPV
jgi:hypothetical protein